MYLVEAKRLERSVGPSEALQAAIEEWEDFPESTLLHHGERCCHIARQWLVAMDRARHPASELIFRLRMFAAVSTVPSTKASPIRCPGN